jgi:hypothetical protein
MDSDAIYITERDYYVVLEQIYGPRLYNVQEEMSSLDHDMGVLYQTRVDAAWNKHKDETLFVFRVVDSKKFQLAIIKYSLKLHDHVRPQDTCSR